MSVEEKRVGGKKRLNEAGTGIISDDDELIGALLELKSKKKSRKVKYGLGVRTGKMVQVKTDVSEASVDGDGSMEVTLACFKQKLNVTMEDTLACFQKQLKGSKKDNGVGSVMKKNLGFNEADLLCGYEINVSEAAVENDESMEDILACFKKLNGTMEDTLEDDDESMEDTLADFKKKMNGSMEDTLACFKKKLNGRTEDTLEDDGSMEDDDESMEDTLACFKEKFNGRTEDTLACFKKKLNGRTEDTLEDDDESMEDTLACFKKKLNGKTDDTLDDDDDDDESMEDTLASFKKKLNGRTDDTLTDFKKKIGNDISIVDTLASFKNLKGHKKDNEVGTVTKKDLGFNEAELLCKAGMVNDDELVS